MIDGVINTVKDIAGEMKKGKGDIAPLKTSSHDGCKYCKMYPICRRTVEMDVDGGDDE